MKRFILLSILALTVGVIGTAAAMPADHDGLKYEVSFTIPSAEFSASDVVITPSYEFVVPLQDTKFVGEAEGYEVTKLRPPAEITKDFNSEILTSNYFDPPGQSKTGNHLLPDIRRLSCN
jgi:hypothetical protein